jgi:hypothetical protein
LQIVHLGSKVQILEDENAKLRRNASGEQQSPSKAMAHTNAELRTKLTTAVTMLRQCQHSLRSKHTEVALADLGQASKVPDIDAFAASCVPLGVADQRAFTNNSAYPTSSDQQTGLNAGWFNGQHSQPSSPKPNHASSFSFPQPPNEQVLPQLIATYHKTASCGAFPVFFSP